MLSCIREENTIIILGRWNTAIFSPKWLSDNLFQGAEITVEFRSGLGMPLRLTNGEVFLYPAEDKLVFNVAALSDQHLLKMEETARKVLEVLPHTPISFLGVNFGYRLDHPDDTFLDHFPIEDADVEAFNRNTLVIESRAHHFTFRMNGVSLNFRCSIVPSDDCALLTFNFHHQLDDAASAIGAITDKVLSYRDFSKELLKETYGITEDADAIQRPVQ